MLTSGLALRLLVPLAAIVLFHVSAAAAAPALVEQRVSIGGSRPFGIDAADLDADGDLDLVVSGVDGVRTLLGDGGGSFAPASFVSQRLSRGVRAADVNGDGHVDAVVAVERGMAVFLGDGKGGLAASSVEAAGVAPFAVAVADFDGDGHTDFAVANETNFGPPGQDEVSVLFGAAGGGVREKLALIAGDNPANIQAVDLDADGRVDLAVVSWASMDVTVFFNEEGSKFSPGLTIPYGGSTASFAIAAADLDADGDLDLVIGDVGGKVRPLYQQDRRVFRPGATFAAGNGLRSIVAVDLNGDGRSDLATANTGADTATVLMGRPDGSFEAGLQVAVGSRPRTIIAADLDRDGRPDLITTNLGTDDLSVLWNRPP